jgi:hypothetical protein
MRIALFTYMYVGNFQTVLDSWSNWNLEMLIFEEGGKPENLEKNP